VESLNMKGRGAQNAAHSKWSDINLMMKEQRISVLTLQETHLTEDYMNEVHSLFGKRLSVYFSACRNNSSGRAGVAVVLNKDLVKTENVKVTELILGRAMLIQAPWHAGSLFTWLAIYAPNNDTENKEMWEHLAQSWLDLKLPMLDSMSGDFNFVEDAIDRLPAHEDSRALVDAFRAFKKQVHLKDGWQHINPEKQDYTYMQMSGIGSRSRIDRIYILEDILKNSNQWKICDPPIGTDHQVVSVHITHAQAPYVGKGRWIMPLHLLHNKKAMREVEGIVTAWHEKYEMPKKTEPTNGTCRWCTPKGRRRYLPMKKAKMEELYARLDDTLQDKSIPEKDRLLTATLLQQHIQSIHKELSKTRQMSGIIRAKLEMEMISRYWMSMGNKKQPRDTIQELKELGSNPPSFLKHSDKMVNTAWKFYDDLQTDESFPNTMAEETVKAIKDVLTTDKKVPNDKKDALRDLLQYENILEALRQAAKGKAMGIDGLPYELWTLLYNRFMNRDHDDETEKADIVEVFLLVFNDVKVHGMVLNTGFCDGWIYPLFKKNDKRVIANYRPITLLNSNYKIMTKALADKL
ncbi:hypothetical protein EDD18DRAFT_1032095, partial [Armillaria luteobubalina]